MPREQLVARTSLRRVDASHSTDGKNCSENALRMHPKVRLLSLKASRIGASFPA